MHYENSIIPSEEKKLQIYCKNYDTDEYLVIDETEDNIYNLYIALKYYFERNKNVA